MQEKLLIDVCDVGYGDSWEVVAVSIPWSDGHDEDHESCGTRCPKSHICVTFDMKVSSP